MKERVSLPVAIGSIVLVIAIAAIAWFRFAASPQGTAAGGPPPIPSSVGAELAKHQPSPDRTAPTTSGAPAAPILGSGMTAPPGAGGTTAPPGAGGMTA